VAGGLNEVDNSVDTVVNNVHAIDLVFSLEVSIESLLDVLNNGVPGFIVVDEIAKAGCIDNCQPEANAILFNVGADRLYRDGLGDVEARRLALLRRVERSVEERVHKSRLAESRLAYMLLDGVGRREAVQAHTNYHDIEVETLAYALAVPLVGQIGKADIACKLPSNNIPHITGSLCRDLGIF
jgi:hypothetical protein